MSKKFVTDVFKRNEANIISFGVPIGRFSGKALNNLREISWFVESFDVDKKRNLLENVRVFDEGNLEIRDYQEMQKVSEKVKEILKENKIPLALGGGHLLSLYTVKEFDKNTKLIVFDAHCDLKDNYIDEKIVDLDFISDDVKLAPRVNDVTWLRRLSEKINPKNILLLGVRSGDENEFEYIQKNGIRMFTTNQIKNNISEIESVIKDFTKNSSAYVSVDIDVFDPSVAPAVDHPEPNGLFFGEFGKLVNAIRGKVVGTDLCCLKPIPNNQITEFLAIRVIFETLGIISSQAGVP